MRQKTKRHQDAAEHTIKDIRRQTRKRYLSEEKIRIVLAGLRGEDSIAELCRQEGITQGLYYSWSKEFLEAGKKRLAGDTARAANTDEVKDLRRESRDLKEVVAEQALAMGPFYVMFDNTMKKCVMSRTAPSDTAKFAMMGSYETEADANMAMKGHDQVQGPLELFMS